MVEPKIFVSLKSIRKGPDSHSQPTGPQCQWDGCTKTGTHRAPVGRDAEGLYFLFCLEHVRDYNKGYNYAPDRSQPDIARYQREAISGRRQTSGAIADRPTETPLPSTARSGSAKALNARKSAAQRLIGKSDTPVRKLKALEARAFNTLGLAPNATPEAIKSTYKQKLKMHHPDANDGHRASEEALRASIEAYKILRMNGFC